MKAFKIVERFELIYKFIKEENTGTANEFADKIGVSRSQLFNYLDYLKSYNIDIHYNSNKNSYVIEAGIVIETQPPLRILRNNELISTSGGEKYLQESNEIGLLGTYLSVILF
ncbi:MAG: HTH domain-containing protein [Bacteroidales bacterium]|nr:HTH domain-containing protein [Bacteroidales bacterium]